MSAGQVGLKSNENTEPLLSNLQFKSKLVYGVLQWLSLQMLRWVSGSKRSKRLFHITYPGRNRTARSGFNHVWALELRWWTYACWKIRPLANLAGIYCFSTGTVGLLPLFTVKPRRVPVKRKIWLTFGKSKSNQTSRFVSVSFARCKCKIAVT